MNTNNEDKKLVEWLVAVIMALLLMLTWRAEADSLPTARVTSELRFETYDAAAKAALQESIKQSKKYEYGGLIIQCADVYAYTAPVTTNSVTNLNFDAEVLSSCKVVAMYHTHPDASDESNFASSRDVHTARRLGVPSYIMVVKTKRVFICNKEAMESGLKL